MAGRGAPPKDAATRRRRNPPTHDWKVAGGHGWQHGEIPTPPTKLTKAARDAWAIWFGAWFAWFWVPDDVPALRHLIRLYDQVERGEFRHHAEMRRTMDAFGITPKGQMDRHWRPMAGEPAELEVGPSSVTALDDYRAATGA